MLFSVHSSTHTQNGVITMLKMHLNLRMPRLLQAPALNSMTRECRIWRYLYRSLTPRYWIIMDTEAHTSSQLDHFLVNIIIILITIVIIISIQHDRRPWWLDREADLCPIWLDLPPNASLHGHSNSQSRTDAQPKSPILMTTHLL